MRTNTKAWLKDFRKHNQGDFIDIWGRIRIRDADDVVPYLLPILNDVLPKVYEQKGIPFHFTPFTAESLEDKLTHPDMTEDYDGVNAFLVTLGYEGSYGVSYLYFKFGFKHFAYCIASMGY